MTQTCLGASVNRPYQRFPSAISLFSAEDSGRYKNNRAVACAVPSAFAGITIFSTASLSAETGDATTTSGGRPYGKRRRCDSSPPIHAKMGVYTEEYRESVVNEVA